MTRGRYNRHDCLMLPPYELSFEPLPPDGRRNNGANRQHSLQRTIIDFVESREPSARIVSFDDRQVQSVSNAIMALRLETFVAVKTRDHSTWLVRIDHKGKVL